MTTAFLDTCVLVPSRARDVLLEIASTGVYRPLWSSEILADQDLGWTSRVPGIDRPPVDSGHR
jgi:hypothetical protein